jgi:hypothetical protein
MYLRWDASSAGLPLNCEQIITQSLQWRISNIDCSDPQSREWS